MKSEQTRLLEKAEVLLAKAYGDGHGASKDVSNARYHTLMALKASRLRDMAADALAKGRTLVTA